MKNEISLTAAFALAITFGVGANHLHAESIVADEVLNYEGSVVRSIVADAYFTNPFHPLYDVNEPLVTFPSPFNHEFNSMAECLDSTADTHKFITSYFINILPLLGLDGIDFDDIGIRITNTCTDVETGEQQVRVIEAPKGIQI